MTKLSRMVAAATRWLPVGVAQVESTRLQPPQATDRVFATVQALRS